ILLLLHFYSADHHLHLHAFPTRRSSDLAAGRDAPPIRRGEQENGDGGYGFHAGKRGGGVRGHGSSRSALPGPATAARPGLAAGSDRKSTRLNSSHRTISYAVFCLKKKNN